MTADIVQTSIERYLRAPDAAWEVFLDNPSVANWSLKPGADGRLRVACRRHPATGADLERERTLTTLLHQGGS
ncbi:hypothetical protein [Streptosporangium roseum]|uniref:hypothetical protein n=1 Tax=Streptosporangium roseum TaxID=2001 RepID=UPI0004CD20D0|nr:hypothetical protein [Streptosporangium roseum]